MQHNSSLGVPIAIVLAAVIIGIAIYFTGIPSSDEVSDTQTNRDTETEITVPPVTAADHILGNPNAPIMLIEYSDLDCPFCKDYHNTLSTLMDEYGGDGNVAWVFRHFPLAQLHPNAPKVAAASECVAELGGNEAFWTFTDLIFSERGTNEPTNILRLPEFAKSAGVDTDAFTACYSSGKYDQKITDSVQEAFDTGGAGTPHTIILVGNEVVGAIPGAQPYTSIKVTLDTLLLQIQGGGIQE